MHMKDYEGNGHPTNRGERSHIVNLHFVKSDAW